VWAVRREQADSEQALRGNSYEQLNCGSIADSSFCDSAHHKSTSSGD
jgi:hypothetical protein